MDLIGAYRIEETLEIAVVARCGVLRVIENRAMGRDDERAARRNVAQIGFDPTANFVRKTDRILLFGGRRMVEKDVVEEQIMDFPDVHRVVRRTEIAFVALQGERIGQLGRIVIVVARQAEGREAKRLQPLTVLREKRHIVPDQIAQADSVNLRRKPLHGFQYIGNDMTEIGIHRRVIGSQLNVGHNDQRMAVGRSLASCQRKIGPVDGLFAVDFAVEPRTALRGGNLAVGRHGDKDEIAPREVGGQIVNPRSSVAVTSRPSLTTTPAMPLPALSFTIPFTVIPALSGICPAVGPSSPPPSEEEQAARTRAAKHTDRSRM